MSESLWQAVQAEVDKQRGQAKMGHRPDQAVGPSPVPAEPTHDDQTKVQRAEGPSTRPHIRELVPTSGRPPERLIERRPYDFYRDQVFWLKETKLELEKRYGQTIPANAIVQLALDLLIEDYKRHGDRSKLVLKLIAKET